MDMEEDDSMEIEETISASPIIERKSDDKFLNPNNIFNEKDTNIQTAVQATPNALINEKENTLSPDAVGAKVLKEPDFKASEKQDDVVVLDDDDDEPMAVSQDASKSTTEIIDLVDKPHNTKCLNPFCEGKSEATFPAADFCLSYYRVKRSKSHKEEICAECYNKAIWDFDKLCTALKNGEMLLEVDYPIINETLQIEDSDEEDDKENDKIKYVERKNFEFIKKNIDDIIMDTLENIHIEKHFKKETEYLKSVEDKVENATTELTAKVKEIRHVLDGIQLNLYNQFRPEFRSLKGLTIIDDSNQTIIKVDGATPFSSSDPRKSSRSHKPVSYVEIDDGNSNSPKVGTPSLDRPVILEAPSDLPPVGPIERPAPEIGQIYYIVRENNTQSSWIRARLVQITKTEPLNPNSDQNTTYKLIELKQQKERVLHGRHMAYMHFSRVRLPVGTRVISMLKELNNTDPNKKTTKNQHYYAGIVAEQPFEGNNWRYLIFFDIGYSQYVHFSAVNLVINSSTNVWEDVFIESRDFIKKYLESQDRPMVKVSKDQTLRVEYNGKWSLCTILDVDCSLVQVLFDTLNRKEWIYRGSTRLSPLFREEQAANTRQTGVRPRKIGPNESATVVQYTRNNDFVQPNQENSTGVRAVARKSTTRPQNNNAPTTPNIVPFLPPVNNTPVNTAGPTSKIMYFTPRDQVIIKRKYKAHNCSPRCKDYLTHNFNQLKGHNPLSKPLLCGWGRMTIKAKGRKEIIYKAPCGRLLRNIAEVHYYLRLTKSEMTVDLFDFNHMVRCLAEFSVECNPDPKDLSKSLEQVPIPVINGINNEMLDFCNYSIKRVPMDGVNMNLDSEFLCGCDCDDDCIDKTKCACWKLTLEGARYIGKDVDPNSVGYIYRRLPDQVITGIYECNSRCKCSSTCLNRVVQNPMSLKLQVFKTHNRGWGIRCLNDVPQGSFICIYAGTIHTETMANEDGMANGDEYFAELDYIESVEKYKEDYEAEAMEDDDEEEEEETSRAKTPPDEEEEEQVETQPMKLWTVGKKRYNYAEDNDFTPSHHVRKDNDNGIRTRLRKRNIDDEPKQEQKSEIKEKRENIEFKTDIKVKKEFDVKSALETLTDDIETVTISDEEDEGREVLSFNPKGALDEKPSTYTSVRQLFGNDECVYVMDAKSAGNIGRFLNHSCSPNVFVQNVFVDTHDPRFPWVSFFSSQFIRAGTELTWNYNYDIGSVPGRVLYCHCASLECKGRLL